MKDLDAAVHRLQEMLLSELNAQGHWTGELSSSALSTATAVFALAAADREAHAPVMERGISWLIRHRNPDGGWGDTTISQSNLSTTLLVYSALASGDAGRLRGEEARKLGGGEADRLDGEKDVELQTAVAGCEKYLCGVAGSLKPEDLVQAVLQAYGSDRTFSIPILTMCALSGRLGEDAWPHIPGLPFELSVLPQAWFKRLQLPVVSYALPALIAMGLVNFHHRRPACPLTRRLRTWARPRSLAVLTRLQPDNGGFLEAAPLTSFVVMSLARCGQQNHMVTRKGIRFLLNSQRPDGSWPIDTNLATWVSTLAVQALGPEGLSESHRRTLLAWLLNQQHRQVHPYTLADPGGWAWTDLPGAVPDADDTPGALLALRILDPDTTRCRDAAGQGLTWLMELQNRDGGIPTFCRGWGKLPFDKSCADLTAHSLAAWSVWKPFMEPALQRRIDKAIVRALNFLRRAQRPDGAWVPLWFGNEHAEEMTNPVYGTARTLSHLARLEGGKAAAMEAPCRRAVRWLLSVQKPDGSWGGDADAPASIEETALALDALASRILSGGLPDGLADAARKAVSQGTEALLNLVGGHDILPSTPIGLYFARLWYHEKLYPLVFSLSALRKIQQVRKIGLNDYFTTKSTKSTKDRKNGIR